MTHGFVLGVFEDDSSELVALFVMENCYVPSVCYLKFGVHVLEYIAAAAVVGSIAAVVTVVVVVGSIEVVNGSIDDLVRYSRIGCTYVLSY